MNCLADSRVRTRRARDRLERHDQVLDVDHLEPGEGRTERFELEILLSASARGVPHDVLDILGSYQLRLRDVSPYNGYWMALATV